MSRSFLLSFGIGIVLSALSFSSVRAADSANPSEAERLQKLEKAVRLLQERNSELENEVHQLKQREIFSPLMGTPEHNPTAGNDNKAVFSAPPPKVDVHAAGSEYKLTLGGFIQANYETGDVSAFEGRFGMTAIKDRFRLRRARITLAGDFTDDFDFKIQGDYELSDSAITALKTVNTVTGATTTVSNSSRTGFAATDVYINWHHYAEANVKVGQFKAPFGFEYLTPATDLLTIERSLPTTALGADRQIGVMLWGKLLADILPARKDLVTYYAGVFNGTGRNITTNDDNEYMYVGRIELLPWKGRLMGLESQLSLGGDYLYSRDASGTNISPSGNLKENSDGSLSSYTLTSAAVRSNYSFDAALKVGPFDLTAEYLSELVNGRLVGGVTPIADFDPSGWYVQGGYYLIPKKLQMVARWDSFDPDQLPNDNLHSALGGLNYYIHGDALKVMADYVHTWADLREANPLLGDDQFDELILRLQVVF